MLPTIKWAVVLQHPALGALQRGAQRWVVHPMMPSDSQCKNSIGGLFGIRGFGDCAPAAISMLVSEHGSNRSPNRIAALSRRTQQCDQHLRSGIEPGTIPFVVAPAPVGQLALDHVGMRTRGRWVVERQRMCGMGSNRERGLKL